MSILLYILVIFIIFYIDKRITFNNELLLDNIKNKKINIRKLIICSFLFAFFILFAYYLLIYLGVINNIENSLFHFKFITTMLSTIFISPFIE